MIFIDDLKTVTWQCVHFASSNELEQLKAEFVNIDLCFLMGNASYISSDQSLFDEVSRLLKFPDYFGDNWDAFDECLQDLDWLPAKGYVVVLDGASEMWKQATYTAGKLISSWQMAAEEWGENAIPFHLVFIV